MSEILQAIILGIVQGLTEFLPISSSGHLVVLPLLLGWDGVVNSLIFDVSLHLGTALAVVGFFFRDWVKIFSGFLKAASGDRSKLLDNQQARLFLFLVVGSIPAALAGLVFKGFIETSLRSTLIVGLMLVSFGILLTYVDTVSKKTRKFGDMKWVDAVLIGIAQAVSLIPGVSRSGVTITAARLQSLDRESSVRFSFLLSAPAILGAGVLTLKDLLQVGAGQSPTIFWAGFISAAVSGWIAIKFLLSFVQKNNFNIFVWYRVVFGAFLILTALMGKN